MFQDLSNLPDNQEYRIVIAIDSNIPAVGDYEHCCDWTH